MTTSTKECVAHSISEYDLDPTIRQAIVNCVFDDDASSDDPRWRPAKYRVKPSTEIASDCVWFHCNNAIFENIFLVCRMIILATGRRSECALLDPVVKILKLLMPKRPAWLEDCDETSMDVPRVIHEYLWQYYTCVDAIIMNWRALQTSFPSLPMTCPFGTKTLDRLIEMGEEVLRCRAITSRDSRMKSRRGKGTIGDVMVVVGVLTIAALVFAVIFYGITR